MMITETGVMRLMTMVTELTVIITGSGTNGQLSSNFYSTTCANVESIVQQAVSTKFSQTFTTIPATLRLFFHDCFVQAGGPSFPVELGRRDGLISRASDVTGNLHGPDFHLNELNSMFGTHGLHQIDMIALAGAHTVGFSHCNRFADRIYNFSATNPVDPSLDPNYAQQLMQACPVNVDPQIINMDPTTPTTFDNIYYQNLVAGKGLFTSDEVLFTDPASQSRVTDFANNPGTFNAAFGTAMIKLGRVGIKTGSEGEIRRVCSFSVDDDK